MSDVQIVKLTSGEELIGKVTETDLEGRQLVQIEKPAVVMLIPDQKEEGKFGIGLAPYAPYAEGNVIPIFPNHIVSIFSPAKTLLNEYNQHYGSKVIVPESKIQI